MPEIVEIGVKDDSFNNFKSLQINSFEDDDDDEIMEDEFEDDDDEEGEPMELGFVEKPNNPISLLRQFFPSKAGGIPAWLDPIDLPPEKYRLCGFCEEPLQFLLQIYAPRRKEKATFYRTSFVFMCPSMACLRRDQHQQWKRKPEKQSRSVKVFRCQLPLSNPFYSSEPPSHATPNHPVMEVLHWRSGHKLDCQQMSISFQSSGSSPSTRGNTSTEKNKVASTTLWPEFEIIFQDECEFDTETSDNDDSDNDDSASLVSKIKRDDGISSVLNQFEGDADKKSWGSFQERVSKAPGQVLRYSCSEKARPLWPMSSGRPSNADIPKCNYCDSDMCFEFQILPQLLYYFEVQNDKDSLDWASIVVYTCSKSCEASVSYKEEFAWVQILP